VIMDTVLVVLAILLLIGVGVVVWQLDRLRITLNHRPSSNAVLEDSMKEQRAAIDSLRQQTERSLLRDKPLVIRSPLEALPFRSALSLTPMWEGIQRSSEEQVTKQFAAHLGDGVVAGANAIRFIQSTGEYVVEFSKQGRELLQVGQATLMKSKETGRMIPKLIGLDGRIIESGKEVGKLSSVAGKVASLSSIIIGAAHIISGADVAKKVAQVGRNVQFLVQARQNEQIARLEAIYHSAQQILAEPLSEHARWELRRQMREIAEVRATWRRDLETKLQRVSDPNTAGFFHHYLRTQHSKDRQVAGDISVCQEDLVMVEVSMVMQVALAQPIGDLDVFLTRGLPSELSLLRQTAQLLCDKAAFISGNSPDVHVEPMIGAINELIDRMSALTSSDSDAASAIEVSSVIA
jgi:hypothetical protein